MSNSSSSSGTAASSAPSATSETLCTVSGNITNLQGISQRGYTFYVRHVHNPIVSTNDFVLGEKNKITTDSSGDFSFTLFRKAKFKIEFPNRIFDLARICDVPDAATAKLADLVFPRVTAVAFVSPVTTIASGSEQSYKLEATYTDSSTTAASAGVTLNSSDESVATVSGLTVTAVSSGTTTISVSAFDSSTYQVKDTGGEYIVRINEAAPTLGSFTLTVS